ncbi:hypothetical protein SAMN04244575_06826, partial [Sinorhizobium meliloti]
MLPTEIKVGHVFRYSYLRHWQHLEGREEGDKGRPCLVLALVTTLEDGTLVRGRPINHTRWPAPEPRSGRPQCSLPNGPRTGTFSARAAAASFRSRV